jgi:hypothetical protein
MFLPECRQRLQLHGHARILSRGNHTSFVAEVSKVDSWVLKCVPSSRYTNFTNRIIRMPVSTSHVSELGQLFIHLEVDLSIDGLCQL